MTSMATAPAPKRGEVWLIGFDPSVGAEIQKVRPAFFINLDSIGRSPLRTVVPITDCPGVIQRDMPGGTPTHPADRLVFGTANIATS
jgi:mRNA-degrading endonuclease toxin of MazEF toxin-antitoxin module